MSDPEKKQKSDIYIECAVGSAILAWIGADALGQRWYWFPLAFMFYLFGLWLFGLDSKGVFRYVGWVMFFAILAQYFLADGYHQPRHFP
jgi:hypothetical protein